MRNMGFFRVQNMQLVSGFNEVGSDFILMIGEYNFEIISLSEKHLGNWFECIKYVH